MRRVSGSSPLTSTKKRDSSCNRTGCLSFCFSFSDGRIRKQRRQLGSSEAGITELLLLERKKADASVTHSSQKHRLSASSSGIPGADSVPLPGRFVNPSFQLELAGIELVVAALLGEQVVVVATLEDRSLLDDHNRVGIADGRETMGIAE